MSRKNKIIASIVGIFIILLALVGITYGYFLTQIQGNTNDNSIYITTSNLRLVYEDVEQNGYALGTIVAEDIEPGEEITQMKFTVRNEGNSEATYDIYLENIINTFVNTEDLELEISCELEDAPGWDCGVDNPILNDVFPSVNSKLISDTLSAGEGYTYTLTLTYKETYEDQSADMGKEIQGKIQIYNPEDIISISGEVTGYQDGYYLEMHSDVKTSQINIEKDGETNKYTYTIPGIKPDNHTIYVKDKDGNTVASKSILVSMGTKSSISSDGTSIVMTKDSENATVNITAIDTENKTLTLEGNSISGSTTNIPFEENTLAYNIINNIQNGSLEGKTTYIENLSAVGMVDNVTTADDKILSTADDDYTATTGNKSYYFRGNPIDNYVEFAGMCWRIVRIQGDGSIKLILASELTCSEENLTDSSGAIGIRYGSYLDWSEIYEPWLEENVTSELQEIYLKDEIWCIGDLTNVYDYKTTGKMVGEIDSLSDIYNYGYISANKYYYTKTPSYKCSLTGKEDETFISKISVLNFDEIVYAGGGNVVNSNYYLNNNAHLLWGTLSLSTLSNNNAFSVDANGKIIETYDYYTADVGIRPSISLLPGTEAIAGGQGTITNPYVIN